jgi:hypothetical protein
LGYGAFAIRKIPNRLLEPVEDHIKNWRGREKTTEETRSARRGRKEFPDGSFFSASYGGFSG